jgi:hypothetical protein
MTLLRLLTLLGILGGGYHYLMQASPAPTTLANDTASISANGFVSVPQPSGTRTQQVLIFAPEHCPSAEAQAADALAATLASQHIPHQRLHQAEFESTHTDPDTAARLDSIMRGTLPIVFIGGKGKANPSVAEVIAEYQSQPIPQD